MNDVLSDKKWKQILIGEYFDIKKAKGYKVKDLIEGSTNYVARAKNNNGVTKKCGNEVKYQKNTITIHNEWSKKWVAFFQTDDYVTDGMIYVLTPKFEISEEIGLFIVTLLNNTYANLIDGSKENSIKEIQIFLPHNENKPDWTCITEYMKNLKKNIKIII